MDAFDRVNEALGGGPSRRAGGSAGLAGAFRSRMRPPGIPDGVNIANAPRGKNASRFVDRLEQPSALERVSEGQRDLARVTAYEIARALHRSPSTPIRSPGHICPPVRAIDFDEGIRPAAPGYTVLAANTEVALLQRYLKPNWYGTLIGFAWTVAWDGGGPATDPYLSCPVTLRVGGTPHEEYKDVTLQLTSSLAALHPVSIPIPPMNVDTRGTLLELVFRNSDPANAVRITGRLRGWQYPVAGVDEGIWSGLVEG